MVIVLSDERIIAIPHPLFSETVQFEIRLSDDKVSAIACENRVEDILQCSI